jgi:glycogen phosphorylase
VSRRPLEALGTSGQKIVLNGFAIGAGETHTSIEIHDTRDAEALVRVLRDEVVPSYISTTATACRGAGSLA